MKTHLLSLTVMLLALLTPVSAFAVPIYLNNTNISVSVGTGTSAGTFNNTFNGGNTIEKVILLLRQSFTTKPLTFGLLQTM